MKTKIFYNNTNNSIINHIIFYVNKNNLLKKILFLFFIVNIDIYLYGDDPDYYFWRIEGNNIRSIKYSDFICSDSCSGVLAPQKIRQKYREKTILLWT